MDTHSHNDEGTRYSVGPVTLLLVALLVASMLGLGRISDAAAQARVDASMAPEHGDADVATRLFTDALTGDHPDVAKVIISEDAFVFSRDGVFLGARGFTLALADLTDAFPGATFSVSQVSQNGGLVLVAWTMRGTHAKPFKGYAATGVEMGTTGSATLRFVNHRVAEIWLAYNSTMIVQQIQYARSLAMQQAVFGPGLAPVAAAQQPRAYDPDEWAKVEIDYDGPEAPPVAYQLPRMPRASDPREPY